MVTISEKQVGHLPVPVYAGTCVHDGWNQIGI